MTFLAAPSSILPQSKFYPISHLWRSKTKHKVIVLTINFLSDYAGKRQGNRVVSLGEKPYFDPNSKSRREALGLAWSDWWDWSAIVDLLFCLYVCCVGWNDGFISSFLIQPLQARVFFLGYLIAMNLYFSGFSSHLECTWYIANGDNWFCKKKIVYASSMPCLRQFREECKPWKPKLKKMSRETRQLKIENWKSEVGNGNRIRTLSDS